MSSRRITNKRKPVEPVNIISASTGIRDEAVVIQSVIQQKAKRLGFALPDTAATASTQRIATTSGGVRSIQSGNPSEPPTPEETVTVPPAATPATPNPVPSQQPVPTQQPAAQVPLVALTPEQLQSLIQSSIQTAVQSVEVLYRAESAQVQAQATQQVADTQAQLSQAQAALIDAQAQTAQLEAAWKPQGGRADMTVLGDGSAEMRSFESLISKAPKIRVESDRLGTAIQMDTRASDEYYRKNKIAIREGLEAVLRGKGFLQGGFSGSIDTQAMTLAADIPSIAFQYLSTFIRESHFSDLIHWQFANTAVELGRKPGLNIAVPRYPYMAKPTALVDRQLTPGTAIEPTTNPVNELSVTITLLELGLGKDATNAPLGFASFIQAYSLVNLESLIERNLGRDYQVTKDMFLYTRWFETDRVVYNNGNNITTDPTTVVATSKGTLTDTFLINLRAYMKTLQIPTYMDGNYGMTVNPTALAQYMITQNTKTIEPDYNIVTAMLSQSTGQDYGGVVSGYRGLWHGFHLFEQNTYGVGAPGDTGTQTVTFGTGIGARTCDSNFAFGRDTIAWCTGMAPEVRMDEMADFGRRSRMIWISHENSGRLDVRNTTATGEQLRVIQFRNLRAEV